ncbi:glycosyltransferase [Solirubrobacter sp. CPCC 204708]|uniref:Glycosyltransferase n=1 Tax=Solirubrobacter deserti TaxID=2282478 RepID=A0ABT4RLE4_9ACTN|nr:glycosyltransferase [Solirubrobacter deserti]MBE2317391.1 glycosyltransferase [Solirubrobacter deserti]MDA0139120.1 glycosyltransferase [Solirubrobacter deserti]
MRVLVVAEYYPRVADPALGVWAHRQALAARDAGADVEVVVLHRPVPSKAALKARDARRLIAPLKQPLRTTMDGIRVTYAPFVAPPRPRSYPAWGAWAAPSLRLAVQGRRFDLVHAHYAAPAGDAVRRLGLPTVVSVHGGDVLGVATKWSKGRAVVERSLRAARLVLANSTGIADISRDLGAQDVRVVHLGTDVPPRTTTGSDLVTVGNLVARKRHADVIRALPPDARYVIIGDGPERANLQQLARGKDVVFRGALAPDQALQEARKAGVFVLPSTEEAFGVAYIEAMAAGLPAIGTRGEPGPEEIARCGGGMTLAGPGELEHAIRDTLANRAALGRAARANVEANFTWRQCGEATVAAYEDALR